VSEQITIVTNNKSTPVFIENQSSLKLIEGEAIAKLILDHFFEVR
jgi:hypothetical protein